MATDNSKKQKSENTNPSQFSSRQSPVYEDAMSKEKLSRKQKYENLQKKYRENLKNEKKPGGNLTKLFFFFQKARSFHIKKYCKHIKWSSFLELNQ